METKEKGMLQSGFTKEDVEKNRLMAVLSYLHILVLIPLFFARKSKFARFHVNQGLVLGIIETAYWIVTSVVVDIIMASSKKMGVLVETTMGLCNIAFIVLMIIGIANAARGLTKEIPTFGRIKILNERK